MSLRWWSHPRDNICLQNAGWCAPSRRVKKKCCRLVKRRAHKAAAPGRRAVSLQAEVAKLQAACSRAVPTDFCDFSGPEDHHKLRMCFCRGSFRRAARSGSTTAFSRSAHAYIASGAGAAEKQHSGDYLGGPLTTATTSARRRPEKNAGAPSRSSHRIPVRPCANAAPDRPGGQILRVRRPGIISMSKHA